LIKNILIGSILAAVVSYFSWKVKFLTKGGSVTTFFLALCIFSFGGLKWSVPIIAFFILSSLLSKINKRHSFQSEQYFEKSGVRDSYQVLANGGVGGILVIANLFYSSEILYYVYLASLAAVCADTWATEIGTIWKTNTYNALRFNIVEQGVSGGISFIGLFGALLGSLIIAFSGYFWIEILPLLYFSSIAAAGLIGSYVDSILGATIQVQYKCSSCSKVSERNIHCSKNTNYFKGITWVNNDVVNLMSGVSGGLSFLIIFRILV
jgi:uncharacterized protein (TIGR00297 family)